MAKKRYLSAFMRHPKTQQEIKANLDKFDTKIRGKRRNLPTAYDDQFVRHQKSWKYLRRKTQYRSDDCDYAWHEFIYDPNCSWGVRMNSPERQRMHTIMDRCRTLGCYFEYTRTGLCWYGPDFN